MLSSFRDIRRTVPAVNGAELDSCQTLACGLAGNSFGNNNGYNNGNNTGGGGRVLHLSTFWLDLRLFWSLKHTFLLNLRCFLSLKR